jgi:hypothetical protein
MLLALLMEDYIQFMGHDCPAKRISWTKKFYIIIPFEPSFDAQKSGEKQAKDFFNTIFGKKEARVVINEPDLEKAKSELKKPHPGSHERSSAMPGFSHCPSTHKS